MLLQYDLQAHTHTQNDYACLFYLFPPLCVKYVFHQINVSHLEYRYLRAHGRAIRSSSVYSERHSTFSQGRLGAWSTPPGHPLSPRAHNRRSQLRNKVKSLSDSKFTDEK